MLQEYFTNKENSKLILDLFFKVFEKMFFDKKKVEEGCCFKESLLKKLTESILYVLDKNIRFADSDNYFSVFVLSFLKNKGNYFKNLNFKVNFLFLNRILIRY